jgi:hypothetical protein
VTFDAKGERVVTGAGFQVDSPRAYFDETPRICDARTGEPIGKKLQHAGWAEVATFDVART